jgi:hypothetical protein
MAPGYRLAAKKIFLTWPQADGLTKQAILAKLEELGDLKQYVIGQEHHQDGHLHFHALAIYREKIDTRNPRFFDVMNAGTIFHGNYQAAKNEKKVAAYCMKDGDYLENYMFHTWVNFHKDMQDFTEWQMHMDEQKMKEIEWPIYLPKIPLLQL